MPSKTWSWMFQCRMNRKSHLLQISPTAQTSGRRMQRKRHLARNRDLLMFQRPTMFTHHYVTAFATRMQSKRGKSMATESNRRVKPSLQPLKHDQVHDKQRET